eukprot:Awhi_evm1s15747
MPRLVELTVHTSKPNKKETEYDGERAYLLSAANKGGYVEVQVVRDNAKIKWRSGWYNPLSNPSPPMTPRMNSREQERVRAREVEIRAREVEERERAVRREEEENHRRKKDRDREAQRREEDRVRAETRAREDSLNEEIKKKEKEIRKREKEIQEKLVEIQSLHSSATPIQVNAGAFKVKMDAEAVLKLLESKT